MKVGANICKPVKIDSTTSMASRGHFTRVCVEIDLTKQLISREEEPVVSVVGGSAPSHAGARPNNRKEKRPNEQVIAQNQPAKPVGPQQWVFWNECMKVEILKTHPQFIHMKVKLA